MSLAHLTMDCGLVDCIGVGFFRTGFGLFFEPLPSFSIIFLLVKSL